jgi:hypothetical protein
MTAVKDDTGILALRESRLPPAATVKRFSGENAVTVAVTYTPAIKKRLLKPPSPPASPASPAETLPAPPATAPAGAPIAPPQASPPPPAAPVANPAMPAGGAPVPADSR